MTNMVNADIAIDSEDEAMAQCDAITGKNQRLLNVSETLSTCLKKITAAWESNGADKQSYVAELEKQVANIQSLTLAVSKFANIVREYAEKQKAEAQQRVNG